MSASVLRFFVLFACLFVPACRVSPTGKLLGPTIGSQEWRYVRSKHFTVRSDTGEAEAREIAIDLERTYRILLDLGFPMDKDPNIATDVVVFRTKEDYQLVGPKGSGGVYVRALGAFAFARPTFLSYGGIGESARRVFTHELTHRFVHYTFPQAPLWLNEGLAEYYETITLEGGKAILGRSSRAFKRGESWTMGPNAVPIDVLPSVEDIMRMDAKSFYAARKVNGPDDSSEVRQAAWRQAAAYASAWALVHMLKNGSAENATRFQNWLQKMAAGEPAQTAFDSAFGDVSVDQLAALRAAMLDRLAIGEISLLRTDYDAAGEPPVEDRAMRPAEINVLWGWMWLGGRGKAALPKVQEFAQAALSSEKNNVEARHLLAVTYQVQGDMQKAVAEVETAAREAPDDEAAAYELYMMQQYPPRGIESTPQRRAQAKSTVEKWLPRAKLPVTLNAFAWRLALDGRADEAVSVARRATDLDRSCAICFDTLAVALFRSGQYKAALEVQETAVALLTDGRVEPSLASRLELFREVNTAVVLWKKRPEPGADPSRLPNRVALAIIAAERPALDHCYDSFEWKHHELRGSIMLRGEIGEDGRVSELSAVPRDEWGALSLPPSVKALPDASVTECVVAQIKTARFPPSSAKTPFLAPLRFDPPTDTK